MTSTQPHIDENLRQLRLNYTADNFFDFVESMQGAKPDKLIEKMCILELTDKTQRNIHRRLIQAKLGKFKAMHDFDWNWPKKLDQAQVKRIFETLSFVDRAENIILIGSQGVGKTMIAKNLAWQAIQKGKSALFTPISRMVNELATAGPLLASKLRKYERPDLLILDEVGYLSFQAESADLLYEVLSRRHERRSTILTTNRSFKDWPGVFPGATCVVALVDRVTHHAEIVVIDGDSYRQMEASKRAKNRKETTKRIEHSDVSNKATRSEK